jgi:hypothetical protein
MRYTVNGGNDAPPTVTLQKERSSPLQSYLNRLLPTMATNGKGFILMTLLHVII